MKQAIPSFDLYKKLENKLSFDFQRLEKSYRVYDASHAHRHHYYEVLFFHEAGGQHEIDFRSYAITAHTVHLVSPEQVHVLRRLPHVTGYVISFSSELFLRIHQASDYLEEFPFFQPGPIGPVIRFTPAKAKAFLQLVKQLETEFKNPQEHQKEVLMHLTAQLLIFLKRHYSQPEITHQENNLSKQFRKLVKQHFIEWNSVTDYANQLSVTAGHLNDVVKSNTGKTAKLLIQEQMILEAKRLLYHAPYSIKEIAVQLKFEDPSYFNRFFKKHTGVTPVEFRQNIREKYH